MRWLDTSFQGVELCISVLKFSFVLQDRKSAVCQCHPGMVSYHPGSPSDKGGVAELRYSMCSAVQLNVLCTPVNERRDFL